MSLTRCALRCLAVDAVRSTLFPVCSKKNTIAARMYVTEERGSLYASDYRLYIKDEQGPVSPLHDIPLWADKSQKLVNMIVEVPRWTNAKMELCLSEPLNPIKQDVKKGQMRFVANVFPHHGYIWNYGALPQTWEDPSHIDPNTQARGDNDPVDVLEVGSQVQSRGSVVPVRLLGALALLDEGETDWKLLAVSATDPLAERLRTVTDLERECPGLLRATTEWLRLYKVPDGKDVNKFAFDGQAQDADFAYRVVDETHEFWKAMVSGKKEATNINKSNVTLHQSSGHVTRSAAAQVVSCAPPRSSPQCVPHGVDKVHFVSSL